MSKITPDHIRPVPANDKHSTVSLRRRAVLAGAGAAAVLPGVAAPAAASAGPDADLIRLRGMAAA